MQALLAMATGLIFIVVNILYIIAVLACDRETAGTFVRINTISGSRGSTYEPVFRYCIEGEEFQGRCLNKLDLKEIQRQFVEDQTYTIFVDDKKPEFFVVSRRVPIKNILGMLMGIFFIVIAVGFDWR